MSCPKLPTESHTTKVAITKIPIKVVQHSGAKYEQAIKAMKPGNRFIMSKVGFVEDGKLAYVSCPLKVVVDLDAKDP